MNVEEFKICPKNCKESVSANVIVFFHRIVSNHYGYFYEYVCLQEFNSTNAALCGERLRLYFCEQTSNVA